MDVVKTSLLKQLYNVKCFNEEEHIFDKIRKDSIREPGAHEAYSLLK